MRALMWFRSDLRLRDNTALASACDAADDGVVAVFVICPEQWAEHDWAPVKVDFLLRSLRDLASSLAEMNIPLRILEVPRFRGVPARLLRLAEEIGCDGVWLNREYEVNERGRDDAVVRAFERAGKTAHAFTDQVILAPDALRTTQGKFYTVFTPFRRRWIATVKERGGVDPLRKPTPRAPIDVPSDPVPESVEGFDGLRLPDLWKSGEDHAAYRLRRFVETRLASYDERRDLPAAAATSTLSPYLALGVLSPRQCLHAALSANRGRLDSGSKGAVTWISELVWREFYRHVLVGFPRVGRDEPFDHRTRRVPWREAPEDLDRWREGRTGFPIVDAGMRQLAQTGWMHNRLRMVTAMFLTKNLLIDWREGERHFMRNLADGDFASNSGGWQWSASVGTDAAPYFRIFQPVRQSERFDPDGAFIREHVPELRTLEGRAIHFPSERAPDAARALGYPEPIVDPSESRRRAIDTFRAVLSR